VVDGDADGIVDASDADAALDGVGGDQRDEICRQAEAEADAPCVSDDDGALPSRGLP
jgi:hypothetical protein